MFLLGKLKAYAIGALAAIGAVLFALVYGFTKGSKSGEASVNAKNAQTTIKAVEAHNEIEVEIAKQAPGAADKALKDKWSRD
jgi:hypothetical protein